MEEKEKMDDGRGGRDEGRNIVIHELREHEMRGDGRVAQFIQPAAIGLGLSGISLHFTGKR